MHKVKFQAVWPFAFVRKGYLNSFFRFLLERLGKQTIFLFAPPL
jgi:hypothetical protein